MKTLIVTGAFLLSLTALVAPLSANHDQGHQQSQDHLHRKNPSTPSDVRVQSPAELQVSPETTTQQVVPVPAPGSLALFVAAAVIVGLAALRRVQ